MEKLDLTKYYKPFLSSEAIGKMAEEVGSISVPKTPWFIALGFIAIKIGALMKLHSMWKDNKEWEMLIDRAKADADHSTQLQNSNEVH